MSNVPSREVPVRGVVLAGGRSTRYGGRNKLLEMYRGRSVVGHVVRTLLDATNVPPIVVVQTPDQRQAVSGALREDVAVQFAFDCPEYEGPLSGISGAVSAVDTTWVIVCAGDMPLVSTDAVEQLTDHCTDETDAVVPVRNGIQEPLHSLYRRSAIESVLGSIPPTAGPRALCSAVTCTEIPVEQEPDFPSRSLQNINTIEEFGRLASIPEPCDQHQRGIDDQPG